MVGKKVKKSEESERRETAIKEGEGEVERYVKNIFVKCYTTKDSSTAFSAVPIFLVFRSGRWGRDCMKIAEGQKVSTFLTHYIFLLIFFFISGTCMTSFPVIKLTVIW